jgi:hypothetical protein
LHHQVAAERISTSEKKSITGAKRLPAGPVDGLPRTLGSGSLIHIVAGGADEVVDGPCRTAVRPDKDRKNETEKNPQRAGSISDRSELCKLAANRFIHRKYLEPWHPPVSVTCTTMRMAICE